MAGGERPGRIAVYALAFVLSILASAPAGFMAMSFYPAARWWIPPIVFVFLGAAWLIMRDSRRADEAEAARAETEKLSLDEIADFRPDLSRRRRRVVPVWLRTQCTRVGRRIKEGVS